MKGVSKGEFFYFGVVPDSWYESEDVSKFCLDRVRNDVVYRIRKSSELHSFALLSVIFFSGSTFGFLPVRLFYVLLV